MSVSEISPAVRGGFPTGRRVRVTGGPYRDDRGSVVDRAPDLRPGSVWVDLVTAGVHLVPGYRLTPLEDGPGSVPGTTRIR
ncbi:hypothetical protein [Amycolatopsis sp. NBC_00438]|uniref:hypothetical protein n=1 Tax=Amycolatopsis sp. NBC_00438 TaxID=2903558 RepID=UPI002E1BDCC4